jgi:hypothetical protein
LAGVVLGSFRPANLIGHTSRLDTHHKKDAGGSVAIRF